MTIRIRRILTPVFLCLAVACMIEIPLGMTTIFGNDIILWDTLFRAIGAVPGLLYFYREDACFRGKKQLNLRQGVLYACAGAVFSIGFRLLFVVIGIPGYEQDTATLLTGNWPLQFLVLLAASPLLEEFFFRGVLFMRLKELMPVWGAAVVSAMCFGLYHGNLSQGIYGFFMGLFLAFCMERSQTVAVPILIHMAANAAALILELICG